MTSESRTAPRDSGLAPVPGCSGASAAPAVVSSAGAAPSLFQRSGRTLLPVVEVISYYRDPFTGLRLVELVVERGPGRHARRHASTRSVLVVVRS